jgi:hypothetical protein
MRLKSRDPRICSLEILLFVSTVACAEARAERNAASEQLTWAEHELLGQCFDDATQFVTNAFGKGALEDHNIVIKPAQPLRDGSLWVNDTTPTTNTDWYLLQPSSERKMCFTLFIGGSVSPAIKVEPKKIVITADAQSNTTPQQLRVFVKKDGDRTFARPICLETTRDKGQTKKLRREIPCSEFGESKT